MSFILVIYLFLQKHLVNILNLIREFKKLYFDVLFNEFLHLFNFLLLGRKILPVRFAKNQTS
jgi:hypothetical protein